MIVRVWWPGHARMSYPCDHIEFDTDRHYAVLYNFTADGIRDEVCLLHGYAVLEMDSADEAYERDADGEEEEEPAG